MCDRLNHQPTWLQSSVAGKLVLIMLGCAWCVCMVCVHGVCAWCVCMVCVHGVWCVDVCGDHIICTGTEVSYALLKTTWKSLLHFTFITQAASSYSPLRHPARPIATYIAHLYWLSLQYSVLFVSLVLYWTSYLYWLSLQYSVLFVSLVLYWTSYILILAQPTVLSAVCVAGAVLDPVVTCWSLVSVFVRVKAEFLHVQQPDVMNDASLKGILPYSLAHTYGE